MLGGRALLLISQTGASTKIGKIAQQIAHLEDSKTPLQIKLQKLGTYIAISVIAVSYTHLDVYKRQK